MLNPIEVGGKPWVPCPRHKAGESELHVAHGSIWKGGYIVRPRVHLSTGDATMYLELTSETLRQLADELDAANSAVDELALMVASMQQETS